VLLKLPLSLNNFGVAGKTEMENPFQSARQQQQRREYMGRINHVMDYIEKHLDQEINLETLAREACFSKFHFHRIFSALVGETLNQFIKRVRVERAATVMALNWKSSLTDIALQCGFSGSAVFSRVFREYFHMSPSQYREWAYSKNCNTQSNSGQGPGIPSQMDSNMEKDFVQRSGYFLNNASIKEAYHPNSQTRSNLMEKIKPQKIEVKHVDAFTVAYVRHVGPYAGDAKLFENLFNKLFTWAGPRGLTEAPDLKVLAVYHDNPKITEEEKLRLSMCLSVPADTTVDGEIGKMDIPAGKTAMARYELGSSDYPGAWQYVYGTWLPESGYQPDDRCPYELYLNDPKEHPEHKCLLDICVPVIPM
jgi:AraC family transcriptional regulator